MLHLDSCGVLHSETLLVLNEAADEITSRGSRDGHTSRPLGMEAVLCRRTRGRRTRTTAMVLLWAARRDVWSGCSNRGRPVDRVERAQ
jgi:hypothetical protein